MKFILSACATALICTAAHADPTLIGKWSSSRELTMAFARDRAKLEDKTLRLLDQMMGRMTVTFTTTRVASHMPDWQSEDIEGKKSNFVGINEVSPYRLLGSNDTQVVIASIEPVTRRRVIALYNFEDENTMWVYLGGPTFPQMNIREYFVRVK